VPRPSEGKWVLEKELAFPPLEDCYIYKRPNSSVYQYFLSIAGEGDERKSTGKRDKNEALDFARKRKLEALSRQQQGLKVRKVKKMFDFIDEFLESESKRIAPYNRKGYITSETFRIKKHHLSLLKKFYHNRSIKLEDLDYTKLYDYPVWRRTVDDEWNPKPPKTNHTIATELTTLRAYFEYLYRKGYIPRFPEFQKTYSESLRNNRRDYLNPREYQQTINTIRAWSQSKNLTPSQAYNRKVVYQALLIMSNACLRIGELRKLKWKDLEPNLNLTKEQQQVGHLIRIQAESTKTGEPRTVQSPTIKYFDNLRQLAGIPKKKGHFPNVGDEFRECFVFSKFNHVDKPLGQGTWDRCWKEIKEICGSRYWKDKNITYYSFRHTGISFAVSRGVPPIQLSNQCGTSLKNISEVYYHHEAESRQVWETLSKNRMYFDNVRHRDDDIFVDYDELFDKAFDARD